MKLTPHNKQAGQSKSKSLESTSNISPNDATFANMNLVRKKY